MNSGDQYGGFDAVMSLLDGSVRQSDQREVVTRRGVHLYGDDHGVDADNGSGVGVNQHKP